MDNGATRLLVALTALAVIWIVTYWAWPQPEGRISFADADSGETDAALDESVVAPVVITQGSGPRENTSRMPDTPAVGVEPPRERPVQTPPPVAVDQEPATPTPSVIPPSFRDYTVKKNDSAWRIAEREYGSARYWGVVARANPLKDIENLRPGDVIRLPLDPDNIQGRPSGEPRETAAPAAEYRVERGDTLSEISKRVYGTTAYTDAIYRANRDKLRSKNDLRIGQVLTIPPKPADD